MQINLRHVTAVVQSGLVLLTNSEDAPYQLLTEINCNDCIIVSTAGPPLVEQRGSDSIEEYQARFEWSGDHDFFDGFDVFWQILNTGAGTSSKQLRFEAWQEAWRGRSRFQSAGTGTIHWRGLPAVSRPFHAHLPVDYRLDGQSPGNSAVGGAVDGSDAGCQVSELPRPLADESPEAEPIPRLFGIPTRSLKGS